MSKMFNDDQIQKSEEGKVAWQKELAQRLAKHPEWKKRFSTVSDLEIKNIYTPEDIKDKSKVKLIFISCGSFENAEGVRKAAIALKEAGINAVSFVSENTRHEFQTWRRSLRELAPLLFK